MTANPVQSIIISLFITILFTSFQLGCGSSGVFDETENDVVNDSDVSSHHDVSQDSQPDGLNDTGQTLPDTLEDIVSDTPTPDSLTDTVDDTKTTELSPDLQTDTSPIPLMTMNFNAEVTGTGTTRVDSLSFERNIGEINMTSPVSALLYLEQEWAEINTTLYHVIAPTQDNLNIFYLYCGTDTGHLDFIWHESYTESMDYEMAAGQCNSIAEEIEVPVDLPTPTVMPLPEQLVSGFSVEGPGITVNETGGSIQFPELEMDLYAFEYVDCTQCAATQDGGWWELHSIMYDEDTQSTCFGIIYMMLNDKENVLLGHGFCLDTLAALPPISMEADWNVPDLKAGHTSQPVGPRHPIHGYVLHPRPPVVD